MPRGLRPLRPLRGALPAVAALLLLGADAALPVPPGTTRLDDLLQLQVLAHEVIAIDARGGGETRADLQIGEEVVRRDARGAVGVVITDRRLLAVAVGSAAFQETRFRRGEELRLGPTLGDRVALAVTEVRVLGFDGGSGNLVETRLGVRERVRASDVGSNVAVAVTGRRALGLSPFAGGFFEANLFQSEELRGVEASGNLATVTTTHRILTFRAGSGSWSERNLGLGH